MARVFVYQQPAQGAGLQNQLTHLVTRQHDEDVTAVFIRPLPPLTYREPTAV